MKWLGLLQRLRTWVWMVLVAGTWMLASSNVLWSVISACVVGLALWLKEIRDYRQGDARMFQGRRGATKRWERSFGGGVGPRGRKMEARRARTTQLLQERLASYVRPGTRLVPTRLEGSELSDPLSSRFGGRPYAEQGDEWPMCPTTGHPLDFILQVRRADLPPRVALPCELLVLFYCHEAFLDGGSAPEDGQWIVRLYDAPSAGKAIKLARPPPQGETDYTTEACSMHVTQVQTLPDELHFEVLEPEVWAAALDRKAWYSDSGPFVAAGKALGITGSPGTTLGGWLPHLQGPYDDEPEPEPPGSVLLIESEDEANLAWGSGGLAYLYLHGDPPRPEFYLEFT